MLEADAAFCKALLDTFAGSTIPAEIISMYCSVSALNPVPTLEALTLDTTTLPSNPAFSAICLTGSSNALIIMLAPVFSSPESVLTYFATAGSVFTNATPPPATIPSSTAAFVALRASSILSLVSFSSVSVAAPTWITATPPESFANLSKVFSLSKSLVLSAA